MLDGTETYCPVLLRLWRSKKTEPWRATLICPRSGEQLHFLEMQELADYLLQETQVVARDQTPPQQQHTATT